MQQKKQIEMDNIQNLAREAGSPFPLGVSKVKNGFNFAIFSENATSVSLCLFRQNGSEPLCEIELDKNINKTKNIWHILISPLPGNYLYGYRIDGPKDPSRGHCFDSKLILLDPYAKKVASHSQWGDSPHDKSLPIHKGVIDPVGHFEWNDDQHPNIPLHNLIIYEMHVRGFTYDNSSGVENKGLFTGIIEKIPHLKQLGINAVELMPIHEFNENNCLLKNPISGDLLYNYWGYSTSNFFSVMGRYGTINDFKRLVKELHANGIEVILDVVYNHTSEDDRHGPVLSFKGIENSTYYLLGANGEYQNFSGCGNTFNCNNPVVSQLILDSLRYWHSEMHVDGFRFDLASILTRSPQGMPLDNPPLIEELTKDPSLSRVKLIAEAWDAYGLYQVGSFSSNPRWSEWNGKYRDCVRRFIKGTDGFAGEFATRISGSEDLYGKRKSPNCSINFVTSHDGFSLYDLVSYNEKHNDFNGENNNDGERNNESWNCGAEGNTDNENIIELRWRQMKNMLLALMVSRGVPMVVMGDEYGHTKLGNNNSWSHDSKLNWFQWNVLKKNKEFFRYFHKIIEFRKKHPILSLPEFLGKNDIFWHGLNTDDPDWSSRNRFIAFSIKDSNYMLYVAFNAYHYEVTATIPIKANWKRLVYTANSSPQDILDEAEAETITTKSIVLSPYSSIVLKSYFK